MGCSASKLDDEEAVQLCKDRKNFIRQAVEQRLRFASGHTAYFQSLKRVSLALQNYIDGDEHGDCFSDSCSSPLFTTVKRLSPEILKIPCQPGETKAIQSEKCSSAVMHYVKSRGNASVSVEERPQSPQTMRVNSYYPENHYGMDGYYGLQSSPMNPSYHSSSPHNQPSYPPPSPQTSQWDFFWNPFSSLENYGYPLRNSLDHMSHADEMARLRRVREEEGIPDLEEEDGEEQEQHHHQQQPHFLMSGVNMNSVEEAKVRDRSAEVGPVRMDGMHQARELKIHVGEGVEIPETKKDIEIDLHHDKKIVRNREPAKESTAGFTVYVNQRSGTMSEVIRDIENQFQRICHSAQEISVMLEANKAHYSPNSNELASFRMLNPVVLFRTASSRSTSSRFLPASSFSRDDISETSSEISEESCMLSGSHQSTLDRLYAWEKKLYNEVKAGERIRQAYEKKVMQLRSQDVNGEDPSSVDKTRGTICDLHNRIKISMHTIEAISSRIERLRDEELYPQVLELLQGLARMWGTMADCHRIQKRAIDEAKLLLATPMLTDPPPPVIRLARSATNLESELQNWRSCLKVWVASQRSYAHALGGWLLCCARPHDPPRCQVRSSLSPPRPSGGAPPIFGVCIQWLRLLDSISEAQAVDGLEFFAAGIGSVVAQQREQALALKRAAASGNVVEEEELMMSTQKLAEVAVKVVCAGMSVAISSLADFAYCSMQGCENVLRRSEDGGKEGREVV